VGCLADVGKIPATGQVFQLAIEMPRPAVEGAVKRLPKARAFLSQ